MVEEGKRMGDIKKPRPLPSLPFTGALKKPSKFLHNMAEEHIQTCLDMLILKKEGSLHDMWNARPTVKDFIVCTLFHQILLYRENVNLEYPIGSL